MTSPGDHELEVLKGKRSKPGGPVDADHPDEVETLKAKLAGNAAATETTTRNVLKTKSVERGASSTSTPADEGLETLRAKRGKPAGPIDVERPDDVETLKAKLAGFGAASEGETTTRSALAPRSIKPGVPPPKTLPRKAAGEASPRAKLDLPAEAANKEAARGRLSAFDLAFVLVLGLWGVVFVHALMTQAHWWLFVLCSTATAGVVLFGLLDSTAFERKVGQK
jgi:hypothetical protein